MLQTMGGGMASVIGLDCLRCGARYPTTLYAQDCPACRPSAPSNLVVAYDSAHIGRRERPSASAIAGGQWAWSGLLPVAAEDAVSLGEGGTPLHHLRRTGSALGVDGLFAKDESRNPTWSFKDRLASAAISAAVKLGARTIVSSSSGNAGAAAAAYAARAGLRCVVFIAAGTAGPMLTQIRAYGATVVECRSKADRWTLMAHAVGTYGWFPTSPFFGPAVGSNPYGIEGYKTLAYEIAAQMDWRVPDWCILPVCYGDALVGMWRGFEDMRAMGWIDRMPRLVAAETSDSLGHALARPGDTLEDRPRAEETVASSISATRGTYQALAMLRRSGGTAVTLANAETMRWHAALARDEGLWVEPSSATAVAAVEKLRASGRIGAGDTVVALLTASGLKDPARTDTVLDDFIRVPADTREAIRTLETNGVLG
jgi:threonine synthase